MNDIQSLVHKLERSFLQRTKSRSSQFKIKLETIGQPTGNSIMALCKSLETQYQTSQQRMPRITTKWGLSAKRPRFERKTSDWPLPLPYDIVSAIINQYVSGNLPALLALERTCRTLAHLCRDSKFKVVRIPCGTSYKRSLAERFAGLIAKSPDIIDRIRELEIIDSGSTFAGSRPLTLQEEGLVFILTRQYPNLARLKLVLHFVWDDFLPPLKNAFTTILSSTTLRDLYFGSLRIPTDLLSHLSQISTLEFRGETTPPPLTLLGVQYLSFCSPNHVTIEDLSHTGYIMRRLFNHSSPLRATNLTRLVIYARPSSLTELGEWLRTCHSLSDLEIDISSRSPDPTRLDLGRLFALDRLVLTVDISTMILDDAIKGPNPIRWLVNTVNSLPGNRLQLLKLHIHSPLYFNPQDVPLEFFEAYVIDVDQESIWYRLNACEIHFEVPALVYVFSPEQMERVLVKKAPSMAKLGVVSCQVHHKEAEGPGRVWLI